MGHPFVEWGADFAQILDNLLGESVGCCSLDVCSNVDQTCSCQCPSLHIDVAHSFQDIDIRHMKPLSGAPMLTAGCGAQEACFQWPCLVSLQPGFLTHTHEGRFIYLVYVPYFF